MTGRRESEPWVPLAQASTVGAGVGAGTLAVAVLLAIVARLAWWLPVLAGAVGGLLGFGCAAVLLTVDARRLTWTIEAGTGFDFDRDGIIGEPEPVRADPRFVYVRDPSAQRRNDGARDLRYWLREAYGPRGTTWRAWEGQRLPSGAEVTRELWDRYTGLLLRAGLAERPYGTSTLELQSDYQAALVALRELL